MSKTMIYISTALGAVVMAFVGFLSFQYLNPGTSLGLEPSTSFEIIAHRGAHVMWKQGEYDRATGCEATHIEEPRHEYIENTIDAIGYAFDLGATMVELDIRRTADDQLVVIHEYDLACKTDGEGLVKEKTLDYLKTLDVGFGFTFDGGKSFPFRGKGVGKIPTLVEVLDAFPDKKLIIHHKDADEKSRDLLIETIKQRSPEQKSLLSYVGPNDFFTELQQEIPEVTSVFPNAKEVKDCVMPYIISAGLMGFDKACNGITIGMNQTYSTYMWGWPYGFLHAAKENSNDVYLMVDTIDDVAYFRGLPVKGIITDYIDIVAPYYTQ